MYNEDDYNEDDEETFGAKEYNLQWLEREMANYVGFQVSLKTYDQDFINGRICGVRTGGLCLLDDDGNRIFCDLSVIALYCIVNPKTLKKEFTLDLEPKPKTKKKKKKEPKKSEPKKKKKKGQ